MRNTRAKCVLLVFAATFVISVHADRASDFAATGRMQVALDACFNDILGALAVEGTNDMALGPHPKDPVEGTARQLLWYLQEPNWSTRLVPAIRKVCTCYIPPILTGLTRDGDSSSDLVLRIHTHMLKIYDASQSASERARYERCYGPLLRFQESLRLP